MKNYRVFLEDGSCEDHEGVIGVELEDINGKKFIDFIFEEKDVYVSDSGCRYESPKDYRYPLSMVYAFSILE